MRPDLWNKWLDFFFKESSSGNNLSWLSESFRYHMQNMEPLHKGTELAARHKPGILCSSALCVASQSWDEQVLDFMVSLQDWCREMKRDIWRHISSQDPETLLNQTHLCIYILQITKQVSTDLGFGPQRLCLVLPPAFTFLSAQSITK